MIVWMHLTSAEGKVQEISRKMLWDGGLTRLEKYLRLFRSRDRDYHSFVIWFFSQV